MAHSLRAAVSRLGGSPECVIRFIHVYTFVGMAQTYKDAGLHGYVARQRWEANGFGTGSYALAGGREAKRGDVPENAHWSRGTAQTFKRYIGGLLRPWHGLGHTTSVYRCTGLGAEVNSNVSSGEALGGYVAQRTGQRHHTRWHTRQATAARAQYGQA